jgi:hypothetical protein
MDLTDGMHPEGTAVQGCLFREVGVYGKQVSAFASALAYGTSINGSVFFNGPRAGINWNDGAGGGNSVTSNLLFNWVRETSDHGNFNSCKTERTFKITVTFVWVLSGLLS